MTTSSRRLADLANNAAAASAIRAKFTFTATGGETSLSGADDNGDTLAYTVGFVDVYINGAHQVEGADYTASTGSSITGLTALSAADTVEIVAWSSVSVADAVIGPASATDNAIARFDATTGKLVQNSGVTIDDSNNVAGVANLTITGNASGIVDLTATGTPTLSGLTYPTSDGTAGQVVTTDGAGTLSFTTPSSGIFAQSVYSADTTVRSTTSGAFVDSGSSVTITGVTSGKRVRVTAFLAIGHSAGGADIPFQIRRDTTDITPGGASRLAGRRVPGAVDAYAAALSLEDTGHGGGDITYRLYWNVQSGTAYLGRAGSSGTTTAPSVIWQVEEFA